MQVHGVCRLASALVLFPHVTSAAVLDVPAQFATIQQAVDAAAPDDVVRVAPGVYPGLVRIDGPNDLTIEAADPANPPTIAGNPNTSTDGIRVNADGVVLRNLRIEDANDCVDLNRVTGARLEGLELVDCRLGIRVKGGTGNTVADTRILGTRGAQGLLVDGAAATTVTDTEIDAPAREGIAAKNAPGLVVLRTVVTGSRGGDGIRVSRSADPRIEECRVDGNHRDGLRVADSTGLVLLNCTANGNGSVGIRIDKSPPYASVDDVLALGNTASGNGTADVRVIPKKCNQSVCPPPPPLPTTSTTSTTATPTTTTTTTTVPQVVASWRMYVRVADAQAQEKNVDVPRTGDTPLEVAIPADLLPAFRVHDQVSENELLELGGLDLVARFEDAAAEWLASQPGVSVVAIRWVQRIE